MDKDSVPSAVADCVLIRTQLRAAMDKNSGFGIQQGLAECDTFGVGIVNASTRGRGDALAIKFVAVSDSF